MANKILMALALMLVFEGLLPLAAPQVWRNTFAKLVSMQDGQLRFMGLVSMLLGVVLLCFFV